MPQHFFRTTKARRSMGFKTETENGITATLDQAPPAKGLATRGLTGIAVSAVGLAVFGSIASGSAAQAAMGATQYTGHTHSHAGHLNSPAATEEPLLLATDQPTIIESQLDPWGRSADTTSRSAVREAIDPAQAQREADQSEAE